MVFLSLQNGDRQGFLDSDLKLVEEGITKSAVAILDLSPNENIVWIYDIDLSSKSLLLTVVGKFVPVALESNK